MSDHDVTVTATVRVELEIESGSSWGGECPLSQVHKQATDAALGRMESVAAKERLRILPGTLAIVAVKVVAVRKRRD
jgi:hypothetical protein